MMAEDQKAEPGGSFRLKSSLVHIGDLDQPELNSKTMSQKKNFFFLFLENIFLEAGIMVHACILSSS